MILNLVLILFSLLFFLALIFRMHRKIFCISMKAKILTLEEDGLDVKQQYYSLTNYYPIIDYEYQVDGNTYVGKADRSDARRYMVQEVDNAGSKKPDNDFFWRSLNIGDVIDVAVKKTTPEKSISLLPERAAYRSESLVFMFLSISFLIAGLIV